jgi:hypothetical protein
MLAFCFGRPPVDGVLFEVEEDLKAAAAPELLAHQAGGKSAIKAMQGKHEKGKGGKKTIGFFV